MASARVRIGDGGRLVIPAEYRKALDLRVGDEVVLTLENNRLRIDTIDAAIQRLQELVSQYVPPGVSLADELIAERRAEAARE